MNSNSSNDSTSSNKVEELKKRFIVDEKEYNKQFLEQHIEKILNHAIITSDGKVLVKNEDITDKEKVGLIILTRYLGNKLNDKIHESPSIDEISEYSRIENRTVRAYLSALVDERIIFRVERGMYVMNPIKIDEFLTNLDE